MLGFVSEGAFNAAASLQNLAGSPKKSSAKVLLFFEIAKDTIFMPLLQEDQIGYKSPPPSDSWRRIRRG